MKEDGSAAVGHVASAQCGSDQAAVGDSTSTSPSAGNHAPLSSLPIPNTPQVLQQNVPAFGSSALIRHGTRDADKFGTCDADLQNGSENRTLQSGHVTVNGKRTRAEDDAAEDAASTSMAAASIEGSNAIMLLGCCVTTCVNAWSYRKNGQRCDLENLLLLRDEASVVSVCTMDRKQVGAVKVSRRAFPRCNCVY